MPLLSERAFRRNESQHQHSIADRLVPTRLCTVQDKGRGVVWEESIIMLPDQCQYAFLSATIPNAHEFAQWVATTHKKKCHVVYTDFRPVPLQHYIMPCGAATPSLFCVVRHLPCCVLRMHAALRA